MRTLAFLSALLLSTPVFAKNTIDPIALYGTDEIQFDVLRKGAVVGQHITRFEKDGDNLIVKSRMNIDITVLLIPFYSFLYTSEEIWSNDKLAELDVRVLDGADKTEFVAQTQGDKLVIREGEETTEVETDIISSNHWNMNVVEDSVILNTLTASPNQVTITNKGVETIEVLNGTLEGTRFDYDGELTDTSVWYDSQGRWIKLAFKARDGSTIEYRCRTCLTLSKAMS